MSYVCKGSASIASSLHLVLANLDMSRSDLSKAPPSSFKKEGLPENPERY